MQVSLFDEPKLDAHCHVLDPQRFPYAADVAYRPAGQELGTWDQYAELMAAYGIRQALFVGPNSGYNLDNRCLLDTLARAPGALRGIAVLAPDTPLDAMRALQAQGVVGIALNATVQGVPHLLACAGLMARCAEIDWIVDVQAEGPQWVDLEPLLQACPARVLIDHAGRPLPAEGVQQPGFQAVLRLASGPHRSGRTGIKLSGWQKFSRQRAPWDDALPFAHALLDAYGLDHAMWASDWPFLRAPERLDVGPLVARVQRLLPDAADRARFWWHTPRRWLGLDATAGA